MKNYQKDIAIKQLMYPDSTSSKLFLFTLKHVLSFIQTKLVLVTTYP